MEIHEELTHKTNTWANISIKLAQKARQYTQRVEILATICKAFQQSCVTQTPSTSTLGPYNQAEEGCTGSIELQGISLNGGRKGRIMQVA